MQMGRLATGLWAHDALHTLANRGHRKELDRIIDGLQGQVNDLEAQLGKETSHARVRHLTIALAVARMQHKKAVALRLELAPD